jgi:hypothetical protein
MSGEIKTNHAGFALFLESNDDSWFRREGLEVGVLVGSRYAFPE